MESKLKVKLISHTPNPDEVISYAAKLCYSRVGVEQIQEKLTDEATVVILKLVDMIMRFAPIGLGCYFANVIGELGSQLLGVYVKSFVNYTLTCVVFFVAFYEIAENTRVFRHEMNRLGF